MARRSLQFLTAAMLVIFIACGGESDGGGPTTGSPGATTSVPPSTTSRPSPPTTPPTPETTMPATSTTQATTATELAASPLQRADEPPPGLEAQFELFDVGNGGGDPCPGPYPPGPAVVALQFDPDPDEVEVGSSQSWCLPDFDPSLPIDIELISPAGEVETVTVASRDETNSASAAKGYDPWSENFASWLAFPTIDFGTYRVVASQGTVIAETTVEVVNASEAVMRIRPDSGPPGTAFTVGLAGFEPDSDVPLNLYRAAIGDNFYTYATTLFVAADDSGRAVGVLETVPSDPIAQYAFFGSTTSYEFGFEDATFELTAP